MSSAQETQHRLWAEQLKSLLDGKHGSRELTLTFMVAMRQPIERIGPDLAELNLC